MFETPLFEWAGRSFGISSSTQLNSDLVANKVQINWVSIEPLGLSLNQCYVENNRIFFNYALYGADVRIAGQWTLFGQVTKYVPARRVYFPTTYTVQPDNISHNTPGVTGANGIGKYDESGQLLFFLPSAALSAAPLINCVHFNFSIRLS